MEAKYRLGKVKNKYIILDIFFSAYLREKGQALLHTVSKNFRQLLKENLQVFKTLSKDRITYTL